MNLCDTCGAPIPKATNRHGNPVRYCSRACFQTRPAPGNRVAVTTRSRMKVAPDHPLTPPSGLLAECRIVLYAKIGPGDHPCTWCGKPLQWIPKENRTGPNAIVADHLDWDVHNNTPENLVPSCRTCNVYRTRNQDKRLIVPGVDVFLTAPDGSRHRAKELTCAECGVPFLARLNFMKQRNVRFCSLSCASRSNARTRKRPTSSSPSS